MRLSKRLIIAVAPTVVAIAANAIEIESFMRVEILEKVGMKIGILYKVRSRRWLYHAMRSAESVERNTRKRIDLHTLT